MYAQEVATTRLPQITTGYVYALEGESLRDILEAIGIPDSDLDDLGYYEHILRWNPQIDDPASLILGQKIYVETPFRDSIDFSRRFMIEDLSDQILAEEVKKDQYDLPLWIDYTPFQYWFGLTSSRWSFQQEWFFASEVVDQEKYSANMLSLNSGMYWFFYRARWGLRGELKGDISKIGGDKSEYQARRFSFSVELMRRFYIRTYPFVVDIGLGPYVSLMKVSENAFGQKALYTTSVFGELIYIREKKGDEFSMLTRWIFQNEQSGIRSSERELEAVVSYRSSYEDIFKYGVSVRYWYLSYSPSPLSQIKSNRIGLGLDFYF